MYGKFNAFTCYHLSTNLFTRFPPVARVRLARALGNPDRTSRPFSSRVGSSSTPGDRTRPPHRSGQASPLRDSSGISPDSLHVNGRSLATERVETLDRLGDDAPDQFVAGREVVDDPDALTGGEYSDIDLPVDHRRPSQHRRVGRHRQL